MTSCLPIYNQIFSAQSSAADLETFCSTQSHLARPTTKRCPDFTIKEKSDIGSWSLRSIVFYVLQRLIMIPLYPAQSALLKKFVQQLNPSKLHEWRSELPNDMKSAVIREVTIERNGVCYDALLIGRPETLQNGKWILQATGNACPIEIMADECWRAYSPADFNLLMVNGPAVGRSGGQANARTIGEAQEGGLRFLETAVQAKQIAIAGHSLGASAIGQAILQHEFKNDVSYLVIRQHAFDRTSNVVKKIVKLPILKNIARHLIYWTDLEMDNVQASKKLQDLGIYEIIIQAVNLQSLSNTSLDKNDFISDGVIPAKASLGYRLVKEGGLQNKHFDCITNADHNNTSEFLEETRKILQTYFPKTSGAASNQ